MREKDSQARTSDAVSASKFTFTDPSELLTRERKETVFWELLMLESRCERFVAISI